MESRQQTYTEAIDRFKKIEEIVYNIIQKQFEKYWESLSTEEKIKKQEAYNLQSLKLDQKDYG